MNVFCCTGNLGKDAEVRATQGGTSVMGFTVAVKAGYGDKATTLWVRCSLWGKRAEGGLAQYMTKGQQVAVSGELSMREWQGDDGATRQSLELNVNDVTLVGGKSEAKPSPSQQFQKPTDVDFDENIPF